MIQTEIVTINSKVFIRTYSDDGMMIVRDGIEYEEAYDPIGSGRIYTETQHIIEVVTDNLEELREAYSNALEKYSIAERRAESLDRIKAKIVELRDSARLATTKAIYQAILDLFEEDA